MSGRFGSKVTCDGQLDAEKQAEAVLLHVSTITFPASLKKGGHPDKLVTRQSDDQAVG